MTTKPWFSIDPTVSSNDHIAGLNEKYGNFDFSQSSRVLCKKEFRAAINHRVTYSGKKVVIVGGNDGHEIQYLRGKSKDLYVVDLAQDALRKVRGATAIFASAEKLPFIDAYFDVYLAFRALFSKHTDLRTSLTEARRILKDGGQLVMSIPNGYLVDGAVVQGMFDYTSGKIQKSLPGKHALRAANMLKKLGFEKLRTITVLSEIIVFATKHR